MKKVNYVIVAAFIAILGVFSSCTPTDVDPIGPEIVAQNDTWAKKVLDVDDTLEFSFIVKDGDASLESLTVDLTGNGLTESLFDSEVDETPKVSDMATVPVEISRVMTNNGAYTLTITATDKDGVITEEKLLVDVGDVAADYDSYSAKLLFAPLESGAQNCALSTSNGMTYNQAGAKANAAAIDILYSYTLNAEATLSCPANALSTAYTDLGTWSVRNATQFASTSGVDFDMLIAASSLKTVFDAGTLSTDGPTTDGPASGRIYNLVVGDVVAFKTAAGKYGAVKVTAIDAGYGTGNGITLDVKVQK